MKNDQKRKIIEIEKNQNLYGYYLDRNLKMMINDETKRITVFFQSITPLTL